MENDRELTKIQDRLMVSTCHIHYMFLGPLLGYYGAHYSVRHHRTHLQLIYHANLLYGHT